MYKSELEQFYKDRRVLITGHTGFKGAWMCILLNTLGAKVSGYALNPPTSFKGKRLKIYYVTQAKTQPPTFILFVNNEELLKDSYKRYLENKLREAFGFFGTPIRISVRERGNR